MTLDALGFLFIAAGILAAMYLLALVGNLWEDK